MWGPPQGGFLHVPAELIARNARRCRRTRASAPHGTARSRDLGVERIANLAETSASQIRELAAPANVDAPVTRRIRPRTAARIGIGIGIGIAYAKRATHSRVDATGSRRRLHALLTIGWAAELLAAQLGRHPSSLRRSMASSSVTACTAPDVAELYEQLSDTPPPRSTSEQRARAEAARCHAAA